MRTISLCLAAGLIALGCTGDGSPKAAPIRVAAQDFEFVPATVSVKPGTSTFRVRNSGEVEHEFGVYQGPKLIQAITGIQPGSTGTLTVSLKRGVYEYICKFSDHGAKGMKGRLAVL